MALSSSSVVVANKDQVYSVVEDEVVILNADTGMYYGLNPVGASLWKHLQDPKPVAAIVDQLVSEFQVTPEQCERDVLDLLTNLLAEGLIEVLP